MLARVEGFLLRVCGQRMESLVVIDLRIDAYEKEEIFSREYAEKTYRCLLMD